MESLTLFSHCNQINCIGTMDDTLQELILPKCLVLEYPIQSNETKFIGQNLHLNIQDKSYKLHGIIYFQNGHFWCQFLNTNGKDKQKGWYHYNDMENTGCAQFVGQNPKSDKTGRLLFLIYIMTTDCYSQQSFIYGSQITNK